MPTERVNSREDAERIRRSIGSLWQAVLGKLAKQISVLGDNPVPEVLVKNLKTASDQLRLDYRLDAPDATDATPAAQADDDDPLGGLRIVG